jgi:putative exporter of polyketide antibiotics
VIEAPSPSAGRWSTLGAVARSFAERLGDALSFGIGIGAFAFFVTLAADEFAGVLDSLPQFADLLAAFFPGVDLRTAAGVLELLFVTFASLLIGLGAASIAHGTGADERDGRLEVVGAVPLSRVGMALRAGIGGYLAVLAMALVIAAFVAFGTLVRGVDPSRPVAGSLVLGLYGMALVGIGLAVGGLFSPRLPGIVVAVYVIGGFLLQFIGTPLDVPEEILDLSLARHVGRPMVGDFDPVGIGIFTVLAVGGLAISAVGFRRRDLRA